VPSPFIFIAANRLKAGQLERERRRVPGLVEFIEASEPRLIAFNEYVNDAGDEVTVVQIHPDAASIEAHMEIVRERAQQAYAETLEAMVRIQVFGQPTDAILESLRQQAGSGVEISVNGEHLGGFTRSAAQRSAIGRSRRCWPRRLASRHDARQQPCPTVRPCAG
jgi:hypothetical protein